MNPDPEVARDLVLTLLGVALAASCWGWTRWGPQVWAPVTALFLAAAALAAAVPERIDAGGHGGTTLLVVLAGALAISGGGPVTARVFAIVDGHDQGPPAAGPAPGTIASAGHLLRGGAWIGALERAAVFASLAAGMSEGVAVVLAVKGLGRYPELRNQEVTGAAERFIIGTFTSVLWAASCSGVVRLVLS